MNRLLKFKDFTFLYETLLIESTKPSSWKQKMIDIYDTMFPNGEWSLYVGSGVIKGKREEVFRGKFGTDNSKDNVEKFLTLNGIKFTSFEESDKSSSVTGQYQSFKFAVDQETPIGTTKNLVPGIEYFIVNLEYNLKGEVVIGNKKSFTPLDLGLAGDNLYHNDQNQLALELNKSLESKIEDKDTKSLISDLTNAILNYSTKKFSNVKDILSNDVKLSPYEIKYDATGKYDKIPDSTLSLIKNNTGEVLGGIFMFNLFENFSKGVNFPASASYKLVDFFFDGTGISSKAGEGAKPSGSGYTDSIIDSMEKHGWSPMEKEKQFFDSFVVPISNPKLIGIADRGNQIFSSTVWMLTTGFPGSSSIWKTFENLSGASFANKPDRSLISSSFDEIKRKKKLVLLIREINEVAKKGLSRIKNKDLVEFLKCTSPASEKNAESLLDKLDEFTRVGIILYYSSIQLADHINENWSTELNSLINRAIKNQQLYMDLDITRDTVTFHLKSMTNSEFKVGTLNNLASWNNNQLKISMLK
jgi:hypothetical protein